MHPSFLILAIGFPLIIIAAWGGHISSIYGNKYFPYKRHLYFFVPFCLIPLCAVGLLIDYNINSRIIIAESKIEPVQVIKNSGFSQQFVLDKNGKVVIMEGYTEYKNAQVDTFYYTGSFPFIRSDDRTKVTPTKD